MNFLSHYYLDGNHDHQQNFGLFLPDFLGIVDRSTKLHHFSADLDKRETSIKRGIACHLRADAVWHESDFFKEKTFEIRTLLVEFGFDKKPFRPFFMTHVMLELLLDRALVVNKIGLGDGMYASLRSIDNTWLNGLFSSPELANKMGLFLQKFVEYQYVLQYANNERFIYALNRLFQRVQHPELKFQREAELNIFVEKLDHCIATDYEIIFPIIRQVEP